VEVDRRIGRLSTGEEQLIEVNVRATAVGYPLSAAT
jgi:aspartate ammonia-lyase